MSEYNLCCYCGVKGYFQVSPIKVTKYSSGEEKELIGDHIDCKECCGQQYLPVNFNGWSDEEGHTFLRLICDEWSFHKLPILADWLEDHGHYDDILVYHLHKCPVRIDTHFVRGDSRLLLTQRIEACSFLRSFLYHAMNHVLLERRLVHATLNEDQFRKLFGDDYTSESILGQFPPQWGESRKESEYWYGPSLFEREFRRMVLEHETLSDPGG